MTSTSGCRRSTNCGKCLRCRLTYLPETKATNSLLRVARLKAANMEVGITNDAISIPATPSSSLTLVDAVLSNAASSAHSSHNGSINDLPPAYEDPPPYPEPDINDWDVIYLRHLPQCASTYTLSEIPSHMESRDESPLYVRMPRPVKKGKGLLATMRWWRVRRRAPRWVAIVLRTEQPGD